MKFNKQLSTAQSPGKPGAVTGRAKINRLAGQKYRFE